MEQEAGIELHIQGSEKLTRIFGYWPSFHDAKLVESTYLASEQSSDESVMTLKVRVWEITQEVDPNGFLVLRKQTLTTLNFRGVRDFIPGGFACPNSILELNLRRWVSAADGFLVEIVFVLDDPKLFSCSSVEVLDAMPC